MSDTAQPWELRLLTELAQRTGTRTVTAAHVVTALGETPVVWAVVTGTAVAVGLRTGRVEVAARPVCVLAATAAARRALAVLIDRRRPPQRLWRSHWTGPSFPSRHTTLAAIGAGVVAETLTAATSPRATRVHALAALVVAVGVGTSRLVLGVHWPTDVLAGWILAAIALAIARNYGAGR